MNHTIPTILPRELHARTLSGSGGLLLDVRTPAEHREVHAIGVELMPLDRLDPEMVRSRSGGAPVYLFCRSGSRAMQAAQQLAAAGIDGCHVVAGGTQAWVDAGLPVERGTASMSLERQVRIVAGTLVLVGVGLGWFVHPSLLAIAAFVGAGLVFAGVTDRCGMAVMLGRLPWNRASSGSTGNPVGMIASTTVL